MNVDVKRKLYLAYGSNLNLEQMADRCPSAKAVGTAKLEGYQLVFRGSKHGAVATIERKKDDSVPVLLWEITPADEKALDSYEGWPSFYRKESIKLRHDGKLITAMVYIMNEGRPLGLPGSFYYKVIEQGYRSAGFDVWRLRRALANSL